MFLGYYVHVRGMDYTQLHMCKASHCPDYYVLRLLTPPSGARRGYTKSLLVLDAHFTTQMIRKNQFMVESDHKIATLSRSPRQKVVDQNDVLGPTKLFTRPKIRKSFFSVIDFCQTFWEIFDFFQKSKTDHFLPQFATRHVWIL